MARKTNVVDAAFPLIGRGWELHALGEFFDEGVRLATILGPGGAGKTRLATAFAASQIENYSAHGGGGVWFCDLVPATTASDVGAIVAAALGSSIDRPQRVVANLGRLLARRERVLLVLDNCEHITAEVALAVEAWLSVAPHLHVLATSRVALGVANEQLLPLAGLAVPVVDADAHESHAVELFVRRARQVRPDIVIDDVALSAISAIVRRLDGQPLAIELAAARTRVMSPAQVLERLSISLLERSGGDRHASMRSVVLDSVNSLAGDARRAFAMCALFRGGFDLDAAEAVIGPSALRALEILADHSLLRFEGGRYRLYETIHEVADELFAALSDGAVVRVRHARYFASLAPQRQRAELDNMMAAFTNAMYVPSPVDRTGDGWTNTGDQVLIVVLALATDALLATRGETRKRLQLLELALKFIDDPRVDIPPERRAFPLQPGIHAAYAAVLVARGNALRELGEIVEAGLSLDDGLALAREASTLEDETVPASGGGLRPPSSLATCAKAELGLGELAEIEGRTTEAREYFERALAFAALTRSDARTPANGTMPSQRSMEPLRADAHAHLAHAFRREGDVASTEKHIDAAAALYDALGERHGSARMLYESAVVALFRQQFDIARLRFNAGLALAQELEARQLEAAFVSGLGVLLQETGDLDGAIAHHARAVQAFRDLGNRHREGSALYYLGGSYLERGELVEAVSLFDQAIVALSKVGAYRYTTLIESARGAALAMSAKSDITPPLRPTEEERAVLPLRRAELAFDVAERTSVLCKSERSVATTLAIHRLHLSAADAETRLAQARELVASTAGDDPRFALRVLTNALKPTHASTPSWLVSPDAATLRAPSATDEIDLSKRHPLRRIVLALAQRRVTAPGEALGFDDLQAAGWPDEHITQAAAMNRLHVALTTLRKLGLRDLLLSAERGYLFDPAIPLELAPI